MNILREFIQRNQQYISKMSANEVLKKLTTCWFSEANKYEYSYHFTWLGRPIIQYPQDIVAMQEIIGVGILLNIPAQTTGGNG